MVVENAIIWKQQFSVFTAVCMFCVFALELIHSIEIRKRTKVIDIIEFKLKQNGNGPGM